MAKTKTKHIKNTMTHKITERIGTVYLEPSDPIVAGSIGQWRLVFTAGSYGVDEGGTIILSKRTACDWEIPQMKHPEEPAYTTIETNADVRLDARFEPKKDIRPWQNWCFVIDVHDGFIAPGEKIIITLGDRSKGSPGIRTQTFIEKKHEFRFSVDPTNANQPVQLPSSPMVSIIAGKADRLICMVPSQLKIGHKEKYRIRAEDKWGNPTELKDSFNITVLNDDIIRIEKDIITGIKQGVYRLEVKCGTLMCESNPGLVVKPSEPLNRFWGDLHAQTATTVGTGTDEEYFKFARDIACLNFTSHQANDFMVSDTDWKKLNDTIKRYHVPNKFVVFPGYEWSGNTPCGGDHNVVYLNDDQSIYRSSHWQIAEVPEDRFSPANPVTRLFERFKGKPDVILIPHVGGRYADIRKFFDPELIPLVEIVSCWGVFEWMLWDALEMGHPVGVVCNSDGHKGRPGAEGPGAGAFGIQGGLTCVLSESLTRESIFNALKHRRCYGTTGPRIYLDFTANGKPMGSQLKTNEPVELFAKVISIAPIESLSLFKGHEIIKQAVPKEFEQVKRSRRIRVSWGGARIRGRARKARWDGQIQIDGNRIVSATPFAFDSPASGITDQSKYKIKFLSGTTGDVDGVDLLLDDPFSGKIRFDSLIGTCESEIAELVAKPKVFDFGGLNLQASFMRYPEILNQKELTLHHTIEAGADKIEPYYIKAIQEDGHMAWASPIFILPI